MKTFIKSCLIILQILIIFSCKSTQIMLGEGVSQGIAGRILWYEGDLMPDFDREPVEGQPIQREIHIYEATSQAEAEVVGGYFYTNLKTRLVKKEASAEDGTFIIELEPGRYSVFVKEQKGLFANTFDQGGYLNPVIVRPNELVRMLIRVDYEAAY